MLQIQIIILDGVIRHYIHKVEPGQLPLAPMLDIIILQVNAMFLVILRELIILRAGR